MENEIYGRIKQDLDDRAIWEKRQSVAYKMRWGPMRRRQRPFRGSADYHYPLIDTVIEKLKPYYIEQVLAPELLASFYAKNKAGEQFTDAVSQWFDYRIRQVSNFKKQFAHTVDFFLVGGKGFLKQYWCSQRKRVIFESIPPIMVVVPPWTEEINEPDGPSADRLTHIIHMSRDEYERIGASRGFNLDPAFIDRIAGSMSTDHAAQEDAKSFWEGIGWHHSKDMIVLWENYERTASGIQVHTLSPKRSDEGIRPDFSLPYNHGQFPITEYNYEITDKGFYSSRGVSEIIGLYQAILKTLLDGKFDYITYCNRPIFQPKEGSTPVNPQNQELVPGQIITAGIEPVTWPAPPIDFNEEQRSIASIAEQRIQIPDFGQGNQQMSPGKAPKTATEVAQIGSVMAQGVNLRARTLRDSITQSYKQAWSLELQYNSDDLNFFYRENYLKLDPRAREDVYE